MAATQNVYLPEELAIRIAEKSGDLNLSALAQEAWEAALDRLDLPEDEFALDVLDKDGESVELRFSGSHIVRSGYDGSELYLTDEDELVFLNEERSFTTQNRDEVDADVLESFFGRDDEALAVACRALGLKRIIRL